jgi:hypothetical protein
MSQTLKELFPDMTKDQRDRLGFELHCYGVKRIGERVEEDGYFVNSYQEQDHTFIVKFAVKLFKNVI